MSDSAQKSAAKIFDLVMGRVFKSVYLKLNEDDKKKMEKVFLSGSDNEKEKFIKKYMPNFEEIFSQEVKKIGQEIESKM